jgi:hypothetical protein
MIKVTPRNALMFFGFALLTLSCTDSTEVYHSTKVKEMKNGKTIVIDRTDELTRTYGAISGHLYGESHQFAHELSVKPNGLLWKSVQRETPKGIVDCKSGFFLRSNMEELSTDSVTQVVTRVTKSGFYKSVDKRYFFKLFGDQYFVTVDSMEYYASTLQCQEQSLPAF